MMWSLATLLRFANHLTTIYYCRVIPPNPVSTLSLSALSLSALSLSALSLSALSLSALSLSALSISALSLLAYVSVWRTCSTLRQHRQRARGVRLPDDSHTSTMLTLVLYATCTGTTGTKFTKDTIVPQVPQEPQILQEPQEPQLTQVSQDFLIAFLVCVGVCMVLLVIYRINEGISTISPLMFKSFIFSCTFNY